MCSAAFAFRQSNHLSAVFSILLRLPEAVKVAVGDAVGDACTGSNPRAIDPATMAKLFTCTYYGTEVDF